MTTAKITNTESEISACEEIIRHGIANYLEPYRDFESAVYGRILELKATKDERQRQRVTEDLKWYAGKFDDRITQIRRRGTDGRDFAQARINVLNEMKAEVQMILEVLAAGEPQPAGEPEPQVYFSIEGTIYGHYDSEEFRELSEYLLEINNSGKEHNNLRIVGHYEGEDVEEYCPSEEVDVSKYEVANDISGTVTPWTLHQIQSYEDEGWLEFDLTVNMHFAL